MIIKCRKRPYAASAIQWDGNNFDHICDLLESEDYSGDLYGADYVLIRSKEGISTLRLGDWVVQGENRAIKTYTDKIFQVKYERI